MGLRKNNPYYASGLGKMYSHYTSCLGKINLYHTIGLGKIASQVRVTQPNGFSFAFVTRWWRFNEMRVFFLMVKVMLPYKDGCLQCGGGGGSNLLGIAFHTHCWLFKGMVSRDEYFLKAYNTVLHRYFLYKSWWFFTIFYFLVDEIIKRKVLACSFGITY